jgi:hypothetical protein
MRDRKGLVRQTASKNGGRLDEAPQVRRRNAKPEGDQARITDPLGKPDGAKAVCPVWRAGVERVGRACSTFCPQLDAFKWQVSATGLSFWVQCPSWTCHRDSVSKRNNGAARAQWGAGGCHLWKPHGAVYANRRWAPAGAPVKTRKTEYLAAIHRDLVFQDASDARKAFRAALYLDGAFLVAHRPGPRFPTSRIASRERSCVYRRKTMT